MSNKPLGGSIRHKARKQFSSLPGASSIDQQPRQIVIRRFNLSSSALSSIRFLSHHASEWNSGSGAACLIVSALGGLIFTVFWPAATSLAMTRPNKDAGTR